MNKKVLAKDIMTKEVVSVSLDTPLVDAANHIIQNGFSGLPVVDKDNKLIGILTEYDFLTKVHLPTFIKIFSDAPESSGEQLVKGSFKEVMSFKVKDVVNNDPLSLRDNATIVEVTRAFSEHHRVNPIPIVDESGKLIGIVSRYDVIRFYDHILKSGISDAALASFQ